MKEYKDERSQIDIGLTLLTRVAVSTVRAQLPAGAPMCDRGDVADCIWILHEGSVSELGPNLEETKARPCRLYSLCQLSSTAACTAVPGWCRNFSVSVWVCRDAYALLGQTERAEVCAAQGAASQVLRCAVCCAVILYCVILYCIILYFIIFSYYIMLFGKG